MFYIVNRVWDVENKKKQKGDKQEISGSRLQREQPIEKEVLLVLSYTTCERVHGGSGNVCLLESWELAHCARPAAYYFI